jgi:hypothetical protein
VPLNVNSRGAFVVAVADAAGGERAVDVNGAIDRDGRNALVDDVVATAALEKARARGAVAVVVDDVARAVADNAFTLSAVVLPKFNIVADDVCVEGADADAAVLVVVAVDTFGLGAALRRLKLAMSAAALAGVDVKRALLAATVVCVAVALPVTAVSCVVTQPVLLVVVVVVVAVVSAVVIVANDNVGADVVVDVVVDALAPADADGFEVLVVTAAVEVVNVGAVAVLAVTADRFALPRARTTEHVKLARTTELHLT